MRPDFSGIKINSSVSKDASRSSKAENGDWLTPENIVLKQVYTKEDIEGLNHINYAAGIPPYLRGPYSTMYRKAQSRIGQSLPIFFNHHAEFYRSATDELD